MVLCYSYHWKGEWKVYTWLFFGLGDINEEGAVDWKSFSIWYTISGHFGGNEAARVAWAGDGMSVLTCCRPHWLILSIRGFGGRGHFTSSKQTTVYQRAGKSQCWHQPRILTLKELCALFGEQLPYLTLQVSLIWTVGCSTLSINCKSLHFLLTHGITKDNFEISSHFFPCQIFKYETSRHSHN